MNIIFGKNGFVGKNLDIKCESPSKLDCNLLDYLSLENYLVKFIGKKINIVNFAANVAGAIYNKNHNVEMLYDNTLISLNLIKAIKELDLDCYYLCVSSVCGYSNSKIMTEDAFFDGLPSEFNFGYGNAKRLSLLAAKSLKIDCPKFKFGCLIPTNMYGEMDEVENEYSHVIPSLFLQMLKSNKDIDILGNSDNVRNFLYVKDFCNIIKFFIDYQIEETCNCSSDEEVSILNLSKKIRDITGFKHELNFNKHKQALDKRILDNSKLKNIYKLYKKTLSFTTLEEGLLKTHSWIKSI